MWRRWRRSGLVRLLGYERYADKKLGGSDHVFGIPHKRYGLVMRDFLGNERLLESYFVRAWSADDAIESFNEFAAACCQLGGVRQSLVPIRFHKCGVT